MDELSWRLNGYDGYQDFGNSSIWDKKEMILNSNYRNYILSIKKVCANDKLIHRPIFTISFIFPEVGVTSTRFSQLILIREIIFWEFKNGNVLPNELFAIIIVRRLLTMKKCSDIAHTKPSSRIIADIFSMFNTYIHISMFFLLLHVLTYCLNAISTLLAWVLKYIYIYTLFKEKSKDRLL